MIPFWMIKPSIVLGALALWMAVPVSAAEPLHQDVLMQSDVLSLREVLVQTVTRNPQKFELEARGRLQEAWRARSDTWLPRPATIALGHRSDTLGSGRGEREWQADMEIPLWRSGQRASRHAVAEFAQSGLQASQERLMLEAAGQLRDAAWEVTMLESQLALATMRLDTTNALLHDVDRRFQLGELAKVDRMLAEQETYQARTEVVRTEAELNHARHRYKVLTGLQHIPAKLQETRSTAESYSEHHPLWREIETQLAQAREEAQLAGIEARDNMQLIVSARSERGPYDVAYNESVGLSVRIPLFTSQQSALTRANAEMRLGEIMAARERLRYQLETTMHEADHNLEVAQSELMLAQERHVLAQEHLRLSNKAFQLGETDLVALLRTKAQADEAERNLTTREIQLQWNIARYNQAVGVLP